MELSDFSLDDYDCIGFDLDCTLAEYNVKELTKLVYHLLANYLIEKKSYESEFLLRSFEEEEYFLQKGLFMDVKRGNILKISGRGEILKGTHGTSLLSDEELKKQYGPDSISKKFVSDPLLTMTTAGDKILRATLDCFDMACILIFARIIDHLDKKSDSQNTEIEYNVWPDILEGLHHLYNRNNFATGKSEFFSELRNNPSLYYKKWTPEKLYWLRDLKSKKFVYLLTGSHIDFAALTAKYCIGEDWKDYFDIVLCNARKPFFFFADHPFLSIEDAKEGGPIIEGALQVNSIYSQGNWEKLRGLISKQTNIKEPKCLYIGDNLIQDVYSPVHFKCCHSVAVSLELKDEFGSSKFWGSYFGETKEGSSYWNDLIKNYAIICVTGLDVFLNKSLDFRYPCLKSGKTDELTTINGYHIN